MKNYFAKIKAGKPLLAVICLVLLLVANYALRTFYLGQELIYNNPTLLDILSDNSAGALSVLYGQLFWLPAVAYTLMYLWYVASQKGTDPNAYNRKIGIALVMLAVLAILEFLVCRLYVSNSMNLLSATELDYESTIKAAVYRAYQIGAIVDFVLYAVSALVARPKR